MKVIFECHHNKYKMRAVIPVINKKAIVPTCLVCNKKMKPIKKF